MEAMRQSNFTGKQTLFALKPAEVGQSVGDVHRQMWIGGATFYVGKMRH
jgi:hypothetical protein